MYEKERNKSCVRRSSLLDGKTQHWHERIHSSCSIAGMIVLIIKG